MSQAGFDTVLHEIIGQNKSVKTQNELLNVNLREFFAEQYVELPSNSFADRAAIASMTGAAYLCGNSIYSFEHGPWGCALSIASIAPPDAHFYRYV